MESVTKLNTMNNVKIYKRVYDRKESSTCPFLDFIKGNFKEMPARSIIDMIPTIKDKKSRNTVKRELLPAADLSDTEYICIDIDNLDNRNKLSIIDKLAKHPSVYMIAESISGNLAVFFKYNTKLKDKFSLVYYRLWLELTLDLQIHIDFLPEPHRLRYVSNGTVFYTNETCNMYSQYMNTNGIPYISTSEAPKNENKTFGSK